MVEKKRRTGAKSWKLEAQFLERENKRLLAQIEELTKSNSNKSLKAKSEEEGAKEENLNDTSTASLEIEDLNDEEEETEDNEDLQCLICDAQFKKLKNGCCPNCNEELQ